MEDPSVFQNISPLDHRYFLANRELFGRLRSALSETATVEYCKRAELALLRAHVELNLDGSNDLMKAIDGASDSIDAAEVYEEEEKTKHNIRALVNVLKRKLPPKLSPYVHLGATSVDILDTAFSMRIRDAVRGVVLPLLIDLVELLIRRAEEEKETPQIGRTHGQHAVPITFGFALAEYVARLGSSVVELEKRSGDLRGKLSGAVGAYNATSLITSDPEGLERRYLDLLGLKAADISTQMVPPEHLLRLLTEINTSFGIIANLADDLRHLQRSEIDEVRENFDKDQVGSSTMPQKRNPWNCEHVKSLWKAFSPRVVTFFMDQISEHQRDLSNSASSRFAVEFIAGFAAATERMRQIVEGLAINRKKMLETLAAGGGTVLAEPAYILLALAGESESHEVIRSITLEAERTGPSFLTVLKSKPETWNIIHKEIRSRIGAEADVFFSKPEHYRGLAVERTMRVSKTYKHIMEATREMLT